MDQRWMDGGREKTHLRRGTGGGENKGRGDVDEIKGPSATFQGRARCWRRAAR